MAGAIAAVVALIAYLAPPTPVPQPQPQPQPDTVLPTPAPESSSPDPVPTTPRHTPRTRRPTHEPSTPEPPPSPTSEVPDSSPLVAPVRPGGCDEAAEALTAYRRNAGTVRSSQAAAAQQAGQDLMSAVLDAQGVVGQKISLLSREFQELNFRLTGMVVSDPNEVIADINTDIAELNRLCKPT
ncbi:hypothetical protein GCM10010149_56350 [Nonomuraea roseoviolacea subsp. roseoviolacea]